MYKSILPLLLCTLISCQGEEEKKPEPTPASITAPAEDTRQEAAKTWLSTGIEQYFTHFDSLRGDYAYLCTPTYAECKSDATAVGMDGGLADDEFTTKWKNRDVSQIGIGEGFLVAGNDFGTIRVSACTFKNKTDKGAYVFETILEDVDFKSTFYRDISVIPQGNSFLIEDVREIKNVFSRPQ